ncbi:hypothetical protein J4E83_000576 [Alternaria metachromatica]|uniref:uncharacterized protein n=1 Tax=Alternaria metachromatica TaxID=283354 RepID=UPI0020C4E1BD|nr:uncharacterized protein J4E83_000576 [Alternaria metachromatica]KAI4637758.1 hypothetical protein J4E83_000576 [Alternaria metachromatica]
MKQRKFSFNLAPVKIASKPDLSDKPAPDPTPSSSHKRHTSKDSICDQSPYINRRVLDEHTDLELRLACREILQNFKPSDHGMENTDPKLDFGGLGRRKESKPQATEVAVRMPTGAPPELAATSTSFMMRKPSTKTRSRTKADQEIRARTYGDMPARANSSRKRADFGWLDERDAEREEKLRSYGKTSMDVPRSNVFHNDSDEDVTLPVAVTSTLANAKMSSSVPTSASLPYSRSMNRLSHQSDNPAAVADAQAAEWMRRELEKKRQQEASEGHRGRSSTSVRPPSRAASVKESVKEYIFPGSRSRALSRAQSKESLRPAADNDDQGLSRSGSNSGWRSWGIPRRLSSRSNSRPGTSKGKPEEAQPRKSESNGLNLNRELPPLPGLDTWKDHQESPQEEITVSMKSPTSPTAATHIASMMRSQEQHQERSPAAKKHRKSGSDTLAMQFNDSFPARKSSRKQETKAIPQPTRTNPGSPTQPGNTMTGWSSTSNLDQRLEVGSSNHTRQRSGDSNSASNQSAEASTFSRKMSLDTTARKTLSNEPKTPGREEQKSKLKKIFSGWMHKKDKKEDWMHKMEKEGVREGVMVQDGSTSASPVVRY